MATLRRFSSFHVDASTLRELPNGAVSVVGQITHPGIFTYRNADGSPRREYRPDSAVFSADAMASFEDMAVTAGDHPRDPSGAHRKVTPATWGKDSVGHIRNVRREGTNVVADLVVHREDAVTAIRGGKYRELSCGYDAMYDPTPGVTEDGQRYDGVQTSILGNHVALLAAGRARGGSECVLRMDGNEDDGEAPAAPPVSKSGEVATLSGSMTPEHAAAVARADAADTRVKELEAQMADGTRMDALVAERTSLVAAASEAGIAVKDKDGKALTNSGIKRAIVAKKSPTLAPHVDSLSDDAVHAAYITAMDAPKPAVVAKQALLSVAAAGGPPGESPRNDSIETFSSADVLDAARRKGAETNASAYTAAEGNLVR